MSRVRDLGGVWGPLAFSGAAALSARRVDGYSHYRNHISGLAASEMPSASLMVPGFVALGVASLVQSVEDPPVERLMRIAGVATIVAGLARCSSVECPVSGVDEEATPSDAVHATASIAAFTIWTMLPLISARRSGPRWYQRASGVLTFASAGSYVASAVSAQSRSEWRGLSQRLFLLSVFAWYALTSVRAIRD